MSLFYFSHASSYPENVASAHSVKQRGNQYEDMEDKFILLAWILLSIIYDLFLHLKLLWDLRPTTSTRYVIPWVNKSTLLLKVCWISQAIYSCLAWDQALHCGKKEQKSAVDTICLASLADSFPVWPRLMPFSPSAEPGSRLLNVMFCLLFF